MQIPNMSRTSWLTIMLLALLASSVTIEVGRLEAQSSCTVVAAAARKDVCYVSSFFGREDSVLPCSLAPRLGGTCTKFVWTRMGCSLAFQLASSGCTTI